MAAENRNDIFGKKQLLQRDWYRTFRRCRRQAGSLWRTTEPYCMPPASRVRFMRPPHVILGPQKYKINILRSTSDLHRTHLHSKYCDSKSHGKLPFRLCCLGLPMGIVSLCFRHTIDMVPKPGHWMKFCPFVSLSAAQMQIKSLCSAFPGCAAVSVKNKCVCQSNSVEHGECPSFNK